MFNIEVAELVLKLLHNALGTTFVHGKSKEEWDPHRKEHRMITYLQFTY
jgi:hypothetical protein